MVNVLLAVAPPRVVVINHGGTAWWVPLVVTLLVAFAAAVASYFATWHFKCLDVNRENAFRSADLIDQAELLTVGRPIRDAAPQMGTDELRAAIRLVQQARARAQPLHDQELDERFQMAVLFGGDLLSVMKLPNGRPGPGRHWFSEAVANVREGLVPHLSAPRPFRRRRLAPGSFPKKTEFVVMGDSYEEVLDGLITWRAGRAS